MGFLGCPQEIYAPDLRKHRNWGSPGSNALAQKFAARKRVSPATTVDSGKTKSSQIKHFNLTRNPSDAWMAQQLREIGAWGDGPRFLICDNDAVFGDTFEETAMRMGTEVVHTPFYTPQANGHCERLVGSVKRECLDNMLIFHEKQLRRAMKEYTKYYNTARPHQGLRQKNPASFKDDAVTEGKGERETLFVSPFLNGLHHSYSWIEIVRQRGPKDTPKNKSGPIDYLR